VQKGQFRERLACLPASPLAYSFNLIDILQIVIIRVENNLYVHVVMKKKLTLAIDDEVIERAKRLAKNRSVSVSEMVEQYLIQETKDESWSPPVGSLLSKITGRVNSTIHSISDEDRLETLLRKKHE
jgi:hypothetical protein